MKDPYTYENGVLKNKFDIREYEELKKLEKNIIPIKLIKIREQDFGNNNIESLKKIHKYLFEDLYEWAGKVRTVPIEKAEAILGNDTIRYSQPKDIEKELTNTLHKMNSIDWNNLSIDEKSKEFSKGIAEIWKAHPFRDGNTRTVVTFADKFANEKGFELDLTIIQNNHTHFRNYLVKASDGQYAESGYLERMIKACIESQQEKNKENDKENSQKKTRSRSRTRTRSDKER